MLKKGLKVMVFGVFDKLHKGHLFFLNEAKKFGFVEVVLATDKNGLKEKGKLPNDNIIKRKEKIMPYVDKVILGEEEDYLKPLFKEKPDVICLGYDQKKHKGLLEKYLLKNSNVKIITLNSFKPEKYKTSKL